MGPCVQIPWNQILFVKKLSNKFQRLGFRWFGRIGSIWRIEGIWKLKDLEGWNDLAFDWSSSWRWHFLESDSKEDNDSSHRGNIPLKHPLFTCREFPRGISCTCLSRTPWQDAFLTLLEVRVSLGKTIPSPARILSTLTDQLGQKLSSSQLYSVCQNVSLFLESSKFYLIEITVRMVKGKLNLKQLCCHCWPIAASLSACDIM